MTLYTDIEAAAKVFAEARLDLCDVVEQTNAELAAIYSKRIRMIKTRVAAAADARNRLAVLIDGARGLFERPRTLVFHGIKVGIGKGRGVIEWEDDAQLIRLIEKHFKDQAELLIRTEQTPIVAALKELPAADLARLGVTVESTGDVVVVKPVDSAVDKTVKALLKNATAEMEEV